MNLNDLLTLTEEYAKKIKNDDIIDDNLIENAIQQLHKIKKIDKDVKDILLKKYINLRQENESLKEKKELLKKINEAMQRGKDGQFIQLEEIEELSEFLKESSIDADSKNILNSKILKLRRKYAPIKATRWDLFVEDMAKLEDIEEINNLINEINTTLSNKNISEDTFNRIDSLYKEAFPIINEKLDEVDRRRAISLFNNKIKVLYNRLNRITDTAFGDWIKKLRTEKQLTYKELGSLSEVSSSYIYRIESGEKKTPSMAVACALSDALGQDRSELYKILNVYNPENIKYDFPTGNIDELEDILKNRDFLIYGKRATKKQKDSLIKLIKQNHLSENTDELEDLLRNSDFLIYGEHATKKQKDSLIKLIEQIIEAKWENETKLDELFKIKEYIDTFINDLSN
ncbi:TPA: helix-turn-helix domain-containing protein [Clostridioides difficile]|nr:helix-turn-helix transcriptional regulator [Clostridioides difficile]HBG4629832.1 helix-turn-helix domain-containing protein [Clostridioides difficile]